MLTPSGDTLVVILIFLFEVVVDYLLKLLGVLYLGGSLVAWSLAFLCVLVAVRAHDAMGKAREIA